MESKPSITSTGNTTIEKWSLPDGTLHREDGPAAIYHNESSEWYYNGNLHREDGPAIEWYDGSFSIWYINGKCHRLDGPAIIDKLDQAVEWWINGNYVNDEIIPWAKELGIDLNNLSEEDKVLIAMKWS